MPSVTAATSSRPMPEVEEENTTAPSSDDEISAQEQAELNATLTALGGTPLRMPPIPLAVVYTEDAPQQTGPEKPVEVLSDSEGEMARENIPAQAVDEHTETETEIADALNSLGATNVITTRDHHLEPGVLAADCTTGYAETNLEAGAATLLQLNQEVPADLTLADVEMASASKIMDVGRENPELPETEDQLQTTSSTDLVPRTKSQVTSLNH